MRLVVTLGAILLAVITLHAQNNLEKKIDSLMADTHYEEALQLIQTNPSSPLLLNKQAEIFMAQGKLSEAETILLKNSQTDLFLKACTESDWGYLNLLKGRSDLALEYLHHARDDFKQANQSNSKENARCLSNLSLLYWSTGKLNQAEENAQAALQLRQSIFGAESEEAAASLNDLGLVYGQTDTDKALTYYEQALAIYEKLHSGDHPKIAVAKTNIGLIYLKTQLYGDAINNFESAESIWKKIYPNGHPNEALALVNLGRTYSQMKDNRDAMGYYEKALGIYQKSFGQKHPDISSVFNQIGNLELSENKFDNAILDFQYALEANSSSFREKGLTYNPPVKDFYNAKVLLYSLQSKAHALENRHYGKTLKLSDLTLSLKTLQSCDTLIDLIRHQSENENDKIELGALANEVYENGVRLAIALSEMTTHSKTYREIAFYFAEKSKSAVLQEAIADAQAKSFAGIPQSLLEDEATKKSTLTLLSQKLSEKPNPEEEKKLRNQLFDVTAEYEQFIKKLEKDYPDYYNLKFSPATASVTDVQKTLSSDQAVISYFVAEKNKRIYQFIITHNKFKILNHSLPEDFDRLCKGLTNSLLYNDFNTYKNTTSLSKLLTPRIPMSIEELIIIPTGKLSAIPFEALAYRRINGQRFQDVPFFVKRWATSYEFAAGLMLQKHHNKESNTQGNIFLCAPINFDNQKLNGLPGTEKEVNSIAQLFAGKSKVSTFADANEGLVKSKELNSYDYLHFATHGIVDVTDPALSEIFLNGKDNEDGNLYCGEIYNLSINANLVVLSACETGLGKISTGEGVIGLSRALVYAGAKNVIVSFWKVADESTAQLMVDFYKILLQSKNQDFSEALRLAKLDLIKKEQYASPYYWAPFILIGK